MDGAGESRPEESEPPVKWSKGEHKLMNLLEDVVKPTSQEWDTVPASEKAKAELAWYSGEHSSEQNSHTVERERLKVSPSHPVGTVPYLSPSYLSHIRKGFQHTL